MLKVIKLQEEGFDPLFGYAGAIMQLDFFIDGKLKLIEVLIDDPKWDDREKLITACLKKSKRKRSEFDSFQTREYSTQNGVCILGLTKKYKAKGLCQKA